MGCLLIRALMVWASAVFTSVSLKANIGGWPQVVHALDERRPGHGRVPEAIGVG